MNKKRGKKTTAAWLHDLCENTVFVFLQQKMNKMFRVNKQVRMFPADPSCVCVCVCELKAKTTTHTLNTHLREIRRVEEEEWIVVGNDKDRGMKERRKCPVWRENVWLTLCLSQHSNLDFHFSSTVSTRQPGNEKEIA